MVWGALTTRNDRLNSLSCFEVKVWGKEFTLLLVGLLKNQTPTHSLYLVNKSLFNTWDHWCNNAPIYTGHCHFRVQFWCVKLQCTTPKAFRFSHVFMSFCKTLCSLLSSLNSLYPAMHSHKLSKYVNFCISLTVQLLVLAGVHNFWFLFNHLCFVLYLYVTSAAFECVRLTVFYIFIFFANLSNVNKLFKITLLAFAKQAFMKVYFFIWKKKKALLGSSLQLYFDYLCSYSQ